jgi:hypothetical protein
MRADHFIRSVACAAALFLTASMVMAAGSDRAVARRTLPAPRQPFAAASPWYQPVDEPLPDDAGAFSYGHEIASEVSRYYGHASLNTRSYAPTVFRVSVNEPTVSIAMWDCQHKNSLPEQQRFDALMEAVPIPSDAAVPTDSDASVVVWQPSTDTVWEIWKTRRVNGQWQACWGGKLDHASKSIGTYPWPYGASASGISQLAGLITPEELAAGSIDHALALGVVNTRRGQFVWPANRTDGRSNAPSSIPEGTRLRLDPTIDIRALHLTPIGRMVARALQKYGAFVRESAGSVTVYAQNALSWVNAGKPDPYAGFYGGRPHWAQLDGIPWDRLYTVAVAPASSS